MKNISNFLYRRTFLLFIVFLCLAYLPVLLPFFHIKNDFITQNLPTRFIFSESLYSKFEPFWNPYINYGIPQYGDMNNGFWNPVQWMIGSAVGYNIYTITLEELFYILIGSWGAYKVCREFFSKDVAILTGLAYMCSGYITGHMQYLCWLTGVGYFPYVLLYFLRVNKSPILRNYLLGGISFFLFVASTHPGLIIGAIYFILFLIIIIYFNRNHFSKPFYHKNFFAINLAFFVTGCLMSIVVIASNLEVLPFISRGTKVSLEETLMHPTSPQSYLSLLFPLIVHKTTFFNTDIGMRNVYMGILTIIGIGAAFKSLTKRQFISFAIPLLFFFLLSAGGFFKTFAWNFLPLLGYVRLNGEFTYFVILILLFLGAIGVERLLKHLNESQKIKNYFNSLIIIVVLTLIAGIILTSLKGFNLNFGKNNTSIKILIKQSFENLNFSNLLVIQSVIQLTTLYYLKKYAAGKTLPALIFAINLTLITWLTLPYTGLGMMSKKEIQAVLNTFPKGIKTQELASINNTKYIDPSFESQFMLISSYSKKIGYYHPDQYPVQLKANNSFCSDKRLYEFIKNQAYLFLSTDTLLNSKTSFDPFSIKVIRSGPGYTKCVINNKGFNWFTLLQNNYQHWKVKIDGKPADHFTGFKTFISVSVPPGKHDVEFIFEPKNIKLFLLINIIFLISSIIILSKPGINQVQIFR